MQTIAIGNLKGGVGKTATVHNLGAVLARAGLRVLLVDCDPGASLSMACGVRDSAGRSLAEVIGFTPAERIPADGMIVNISPDLDLLPADIGLSSIELALVTRLGRETVIRKAIAPLADRYDLCLLDTHPGLQLLTVAALTAADGLIICTQPQAADLRSLRLFLDAVNTIKSELNTGLETLGILVTFYDPRLNHHRQAVDLMTGAGLPVFPVMIGRSVRIAESAGVGQAVIDYEPHNPQAANYLKLAEIIKPWLKRKP